MEFKICPKCREKKSIENFRIRKKSKNGLQSWCRLCMNKSRMDAYWKNPEINAKNYKKNVKRNQNFVDSFLETHPCIDCGETDILVLEFDHTKGDKDLEVRTIASWGYSLNKIMEEISKCEVRCANCHTRRHKLARLVQGLLTQ